MKTLDPEVPPASTPRQALALAAALLACMGAQADEQPAVTPYRPTVSTPAALSAPGWLEVEAGVQRSHADDPQRRDSVPYTLKLAFTPDWGIRVGGDAFVHQLDANGDSTRGVGDTSIVLKRRFAVDDASAFGLEAGVKLATARAGLGSGHMDSGLNGIYSSDFAPKWHVDINLSASHLGGTAPGESAWQKAWAGAFSRTLDEHWTAAAELSGTQRNGADRTTQALVAASYAVSPAIGVDAGASKGLNTASGGWSVFSGITFLAARLF